MLKTSLYFIQWKTLAFYILYINKTPRKVEEKHTFSCNNFDRNNRSLFENQNNFKLVLSSLLALTSSNILLITIGPLVKSLKTSTPGMELEPQRAQFLVD